MLVNELKKKKFKWNEVESIAESVALELLITAYNLYIDKTIPYEDVLSNCVNEIKTKNEYLRGCK